MKNVLLYVVLALMILPTTSICADDVPLTFSRLELRDGRVLRRVVVKTYDAPSAKLLVVADGKALVIPIALLPSPLDEQLKKAPASGGTVNIAAAPPSRPIASSADQYAVAVPKTAPPVIKHPPNRPAPIVIVGQPPTIGASDLRQHQQTARSRAEQFYRYEYQVGSASSVVTSLNLEISVPQPIPGWDGRCRTEGKAFLNFYDSRGRSFQRTTSQFEVVTERSATHGLVVVDFNRKS